MVVGVGLVVEIVVVVVVGGGDSERCDLLPVTP